MSQILGSQAGPADAVREYDDVRRVVQLFLDGESKGDAAKLQEASHPDTPTPRHPDTPTPRHPDTRMFGSVGGTRYDLPVADFIELAVKEPRDTGNHRTCILSVQQAEDAAVAQVAEEGYCGSLSFVDHFQLARIEGTWKVVSKLFAHTGGDLPAST